MIYLVISLSIPVFVSAGGGTSTPGEGEGKLGQKQAELDKAKSLRNDLQKEYDELTPEEKQSPKGKAAKSEIDALDTSIETMQTSLDTAKGHLEEAKKQQKLGNEDKVAKALDDFDDELDDNFDEAADDAIESIVGAKDALGLELSGWESLINQLGITGARVAVQAGKGALSVGLMMFAGLPPGVPFGIGVLTDLTLTSLADIPSTTTNVADALGGIFGQDVSQQTLEGIQVGPDSVSSPPNN